MPDTGPNFNSSITRFDEPNIIARNRHLASLLPIALAPTSGGTDYAAGTVLAYNTSTNLYGPYGGSGGTNGTNIAACILEQPILNLYFQGAASGSVYTSAIFKGEVWSNKLTYLDANAITNLNGRQVTDAFGSVTLLF